MLRNNEQNTDSLNTLTRLRVWICVAVTEIQVKQGDWSWIAIVHRLKTETNVFSFPGILWIYLSLLETLHVLALTPII